MPPRPRAHIPYAILIGFLCVALSGCAPDPHFGTLTPDRKICKLGGFDQTLELAPDFHIDRIGHDAYLSEATFRAEFNKQAADINKFSKCSGTKIVGNVDFKLRRLEVGSNRSAGMKVLMWSVLLILSLGFSSIYPLTEQRWLTLELDAEVTVGKRLVWRGEFSSHIDIPALMKEAEGTGVYISQLIVKAQDRALIELGQLVPATTP